MTTTISAAQGASTATLSPETEITLSHELANQLKAELGNRSLERLEQECRELIQTTAYAALELGKRLLMIKEVVGHGNWLLALQRIGLSASMTRRIMQAAARILPIPNYSRLIEAAKNKSKLFELLVLDDDELEALNLGESVRGVSLGNMPNNSVVTLRSMLRAEVPCAADSAPVTPPNAAAVVGLATSVPLVSGDQVKSLHAGRPGKVVKVYPDGSVCVCWDDGEPQAEGLGHERVPRQLLVLIECAPAAPEAVAGASAPADKQADLTAVFSMARAELSGDELSSAEDDPVSQAMDEDSAELRAILDRQANAYAKAHNVSYGEAIGTVGGQAIGELARLSGDGEDISSHETGAVAGNDALSNRLAQSGVTLEQRFKQLNTLHNSAWDMMSRVSHQIRALWVVLNEKSSSTTAESIDVGTLIDVTASIVESHNDLFNDMEDVITDIERRILREPESGRLLPESVWLELVAELATERKALSGEESIQLASLATKLHRFASSSPEVSAALDHLQSVTERYGVKLYEHSPSNTMCFNWIPGREPVKQRRAAMSH